MLMLSKVPKNGRVCGSACSSGWEQQGA